MCREKARSARYCVLGAPASLPAEQGQEDRGAERAFWPGSASWAKLGNAETGGEHVPGVEKRDESMRAGKPWLVSNPAVPRGQGQCVTGRGPCSCGGRVRPGHTRLRTRALFDK